MKNVNFLNSTSLAATPTTPRPEGALVLVGVHSNPDHAFATTLNGVGGSVDAELMHNIKLEYPTDWHWNK
jgi:hypothetical protein